MALCVGSVVCGEIENFQNSPVCGSCGVWALWCVETLKIFQSSPVCGLETLKYFQNFKVSLCVGVWVVKTLRYLKFLSVGTLCRVFSFPVRGLCTVLCKNFEKFKVSCVWVSYLL